MRQITPRDPALALVVLGLGLGLGLLGGAAATASARGLERVQFEVDLGSGKIRRLKGAAPPALRAGTPAHATATAIDEVVIEAGHLVVREKASAAVRLRIDLQAREHEWMPFSLLTDGVLVFSWRRFEPAARPADERYHDVLSGYDLGTGKLLWQEDTRGFAMQGFEIAPGRVLLHGVVGLELLDAHTGKHLAQVAETSQVAWLEPVPGSKTDWFIKDGEHLMRADLATGALRWKIESGSRGAPIAHGQKLVDLQIVNVTRYQVSEAWLTFTDAATGKPGKRKLVQRYSKFHDLGGGVIARVGKARAVVTLEWIILD